MGRKKSFGWFRKEIVRARWLTQEATDDGADGARHQEEGRGQADGDVHGDGGGHVVDGVHLGHGHQDSAANLGKNKSIFYLVMSSMINPL